MRKINIITVFLLISQILSIKAQSYVPMKLDNASLWKVESGFDLICLKSTTYDDYRIQGDSLYKGILYKKLYSKGYNKLEQKGFPGCSPWSVSYSYFNSTFRCLIREDTLLHKVYFADSRFPNDTLIYDFNLLPGDTIISPLNEYKYKLTVDSINYKLLSDGLNHKFIWYHGMSPHIGALIEGVGTSFGLIENLSFFEDFAQLDCYSYSGNAVYSNSSFTQPCIEFVTAEEIEKAGAPKIYPCPATESITLTFIKSMKRSFFIFNITGQIVVKSESKETDCNLNIAYLTPGIYFVKIIESEKSYNLKFIKN
ncbi:MAG: T9SS type A sorting domain-containing protein [Bacteroidales bacterium]